MASRSPTWWDRGERNIKKERSLMYVWEAYRGCRWAFLLWRGEAWNSQSRIGPNNVRRGTLFSKAEKARRANTNYPNMYLGS